MITTYEITTNTRAIYRIADDDQFGLLAQSPYQLGPAKSVRFRIGAPGEITWLSGPTGQLTLSAGSSNESDHDSLT
jgi:hypothetical protein